MFWRYQFPNYLRIEICRDGPAGSSFCYASGEYTLLIRLACARHLPRKGKAFGRLIAAPTNRGERSQNRAGGPGVPPLRVERLLPQWATARVAPTAFLGGDSERRVREAAPYRGRPLSSHAVGAGPRPACGRGKPLTYVFQGHLPSLGRGGPWASRWDSHQSPPAWPSQAQNRNRTGCNFGTARPQWAGRIRKPPLRFCAPEMFCLIQGVTPVMEVQGADSPCQGEMAEGQRG